MPYKRSSNFESNLSPPLTPAANSGSLRPLFERPSSRTSPEGQEAINFEDQLFENGVYIYHSQSAAFRDRPRAQRGLESEVRDGLSWNETVSGIVPVNWNIWYNIDSAFRAAAEEQVQLSPELIYAGLLHPHHLVIKAVGEHQLLSQEQLALCLIRYQADYPPEWDIDHILKVQKSKGVSEADLQVAYRLAVEKSGSALMKQALDPFLDDIAYRQRQRLSSHAGTVVKSDPAAALGQYTQRYLKLARQKRLGSLQTIR